MSLWMMAIQELLKRLLGKLVDLFLPSSETGRSARQEWDVRIRVRRESHTKLVAVTRKGRISRRPRTKATKKAAKQYRGT